MKPHQTQSIGRHTHELYTKPRGAQIRTGGFTPSYPKFRAEPQPPGRPPHLRPLAHSSHPCARPDRQRRGPGQAGSALTARGRLRTRGPRARAVGEELEKTPPPPWGAPFAPSPGQPPPSDWQLLENRAHAPSHRAKHAGVVNRWKISNKLMKLEISQVIVKVSLKDTEMKTAGQPVLNLGPTLEWLRGELSEMQIQDQRLLLTLRHLHNVLEELRTPSTQWEDGRSSGGTSPIRARAGSEGRCCQPVASRGLAQLLQGEENRRNSLP
ncbi:PREDICTED: uncharacterized protein C20orf202 homolog [Chinchilla lanigera]|uniref:uncharacterized protein C20orf202 homolog n=1 Tax=Chinchilla lanigera TaxID=34839 RepID=UPI00038EDB62|nr:PREDICTED: uncharacterized protein C20orf202 homolog [Chinchilla lanigera]